MTLDDIMKLIQQLLTMYKKTPDRDRIVAVIENVYGLIMDDDSQDEQIIDFLDSVLFDVDYLIENRSEIKMISKKEKENEKRRRKMLQMFSEDYLGRDI